jgi:hypothetical protein
MTHLHLAGIEPAVPHESLRLFDERHKTLADFSVDFGTILRIEMVMTNYRKRCSSFVLATVSPRTVVEARNDCPLEQYGCLPHTVKRSSPKKGIIVSRHPRSDAVAIPSARIAAVAPR